MESLALAQMVDEVVQFVDERAGGPEIRALVGQQGGVAAAQLVVMDDRAAIAAQQLVGSQHNCAQHPGRHEA